MLELESEPARRADLSKRMFCPTRGGIIARHFRSVKRAVLVYEYPGCAGFWLGSGGLAAAGSEHPTEEDHKKAAREHLSELFDPGLAVARARTVEELKEARRIARAFRFIWPSYYLPCEQNWGAFPGAQPAGSKVAAPV